jgi:hypothetical protein
MPIEFACPQCQTKARASDDAAGRKGKCRKRGFLITVPVAKVATGSGGIPRTVDVSAKVLPVPTRQCENCDRQFGKLETPMDWHGNLVCLACYEKLQGAADLERWKREAAASSQPNGGLTPPSPKVDMADGPSLESIHDDQNLSRRRVRLQMTFAIGGIVAVLAGLLTLLIGRRDDNDHRDIYFAAGGSASMLLLVWCAAVALWNKRLLEELRKHAAAAKARPQSVSTMQARLLSIREIAVYIFICTLIGGTGVWAMCSIDSRIGDWGEAPTMLAVGSTGLVFVLVLIPVVRALFRSRCAACGYFGMALVTSIQHLGTDETYETRQQRVDVHAGGSPIGRVIANYSVPIQHRMLTTHFRESCTCKHCGNKWNRSKSYKFRA